MIAVIFATLSAHAQNFPVKNYRTAYMGADSVPVIVLHTVFIFSTPAGEQKFLRQVENVKKVYPLAKEARRLISEMEQKLATISDPAAQRDYIKRMESALIKEYAPVVTKLTPQQGRILIKLVDRELERTSFAIIGDMLGGVSAGLWQGLAMLFGSNLKDGYNKTGEDETLEEIITLYEHGMI